MRQRLVITDVTQMPQGDEVCVVGISEDGDSIRPVCDGGFKKIYCYCNSRLAIYPRAEVEFDLMNNRPQLPYGEPPHCEDKLFSTTLIEFVREYNDADFERMLIKTGFQSIEKMYSGYFVNHKYVLPGTGIRSIGTLTDVHMDELKIIDINRSAKPKLIFKDGSGWQYSMPVSDLSVRSECFERIRRKNESVASVESDITQRLKKFRKIYVRIGLARPWQGDYTSEPRCYPQVTAIHLLD